MYNEIKSALDKKFIETDKVARILSLAIDGKKNAILHGPAGHGKSDMTEHVMKELGYRDDCFIYSFGEGMTEDLLWGGINYKHFKKEDEIQFNPEHSFLNYKFAIFEEIFDAPPIVLMALKDTLTAKQLRKGPQTFDMKTECIIGLTNKEPAEISQLGPAAHALTERFPLQLNVKWDKYNLKQFSKLFKKVYPNTDETIRETLAEMIDKSHRNGQFISPRTAIHALQTIILNQDEGIKAYRCLEFIPGLEDLAENIEQDIKDAQERQQAKDKINDLELDVQILNEEFQNANTPSRCLQVMKQGQQLDEDAQMITLPDNLHKKRNEFRSAIQDIITGCSDKAMKLTKTKPLKKSDNNSESGNTQAPDEPNS